MGFACLKIRLRGKTAQVDSVFYLSLAPQWAKCPYWTARAKISAVTWASCKTWLPPQKLCSDLIVITAVHRAVDKGESEPSVGWHPQCLFNPTCYGIRCDARRLARPGE